MEREGGGALTEEADDRIVPHMHAPKYIHMYGHVQCS